MGYSLDDIIQVDYYQDYLEQGVLNSLFYKIVTIAAGAVTEALLNAFCDLVINWIKDLQSSDLTHVGQTVYNLSDGLTVSNFTTVVAGTVTTSDNMASYVAVGMKKSVSSRITRPGSIRITGIKESSVVGNFLTTGAASAFDSVGALLGAPINVVNGGNDVTFQPVVVGRNADGSFNLAKINYIVDIGLPRLTSQNSRKFWRGQ